MKDELNDLKVPTVSEFTCRREAHTIDEKRFLQFKKEFGDEELFFIMDDITDMKIRYFATLTGKLSDPFKKI